MSRGEAYIHDERREYLAHVLSRTKRKDYENYVVNAVWQRLADPYLQPETQRYVRRDNGYALIDLYFPAVNVGVECDEAYHLGDWQRKSDKAREEEIAARLNSVDGAGGVGFVGIDMHRQGELGADADDHFAEDQFTALDGGDDLNGNNVLILHAELFGVGGGHMDVTLGGDNALGQLHFAAGAHQLAGAGTGHVAGFAHGRGHADGAGVGERQLNLVFRPHGPKDADALDGVLGADHVHLLFAGELSGLAQILDGLQGMARAEENLQRFLGYVYVTGGGFHDELAHLFFLLSL